MVLLDSLIITVALSFLDGIESISFVAKDKRQNEKKPKLTEAEKNRKCKMKRKGNDLLVSCRCKETGSTLSHFERSNLAKALCGRGTTVESWSMKTRGGRL